MLKGLQGDMFVSYDGRDEICIDLSELPWSIRTMKRVLVSTVIFAIALACLLSVVRLLGGGGASDSMPSEATGADKTIQVREPKVSNASGSTHDRDSVESGKDGTSEMDASGGGAKAPQKQAGGDSIDINSFLEKAPPRFNPFIFAGLYVVAVALGYIGAEAFVPGAKCLAVITFVLAVGYLIGADIVRDSYFDSLPAIIERSYDVAAVELDDRGQPSDGDGISWVSAGTVEHGKIRMAGGFLSIYPEGSTEPLVRRTNDE